MTDDAVPARVALARIEMRKQICNAILHLLDADAPIGDVVQLSYGLMREIDQSSRREELAHVVQALEFAAGDGIVAMLREDREMQLIEHKERWLGYVRERRTGETDEEWNQRLRTWGIEP
jgi:hypothetical protein